MGDQSLTTHIVQCVLNLLPQFAANFCGLLVIWTFQAFEDKLGSFCPAAMFSYCRGPYFATVVFNVVYSQLAAMKHDQWATQYSLCPLSAMYINSWIMRVQMFTFLHERVACVYSHAYRLTLQLCRVRMLYTPWCYRKGTSIVSLSATEGLKIIVTKLKLPAINLIHTDYPYIL